MIPPTIAPTVQVNVLGILAANATLVVAPLQIVCANGATPTGEGLTVTVIVYGVPTQPVAIVYRSYNILYCSRQLHCLGLLRSVLIVVPQAAAQGVAPVIPPVITPTIQVNVLGPVLDTKPILMVPPLQIVAVFGVDTILGSGFTVTVILNGAPTQPPGLDVGVMIYCTVPAVTLLGFIKFCVMAEPPDADAPVMPPVTVPIVQVNVLGTVAVNTIFKATLLQVDAVAALVPTGTGFTVTNCDTDCIQPGSVGRNAFGNTTVYCISNGMRDPHLTAAGLN